MAKITMENICALTGADLGEFVALKGRDHVGSIHYGDCFNYVFLEHKFCRAMFPKDKQLAMSTDWQHHLPMAFELLHAICSGRLTVIRNAAGNRQYVYGYSPKNVKDEEDVYTQGSLF